MLEASPSPVYGAALLMRFGTSIPSRVQIPPPPLEHRSPGPGDRGFVVPHLTSPHLTRPDRAPEGPSEGVFAGHKGYGKRISHDGGSHVMFFLSPRAGRKGRERRQKNRITSTRSLTDRASDYGSEGCRFESCRVHTVQRPRRDPGPLAFRGRTAAKYSNGCAGSSHPTTDEPGRAEQRRPVAANSFVQWRAPPGRNEPRPLQGVWATADGMEPGERVERWV